MSFVGCRSCHDSALTGSFIVLSGGDAKKCLELKKSPPYTNVECMHMLRFQLTQTLQFITRLIYHIRLDENHHNEHFKCCHNSDRLEWIDRKDIVEGKVEHCYGPELVEFTARLNSKIELCVSEFSLKEAFIYVPRNPPGNLEEELLSSVVITEKDIARLYDDFIDHNFPSFYQSFDSFLDYMTKYGFEKKVKRVENLFNAFNYRKNGRLSFNEFLLGMACIEPSSVHTRLRAQFLFRYYDNDKNGQLSEKDVEHILRDIHPNSGQEAFEKLKQNLFGQLEWHTSTNAHGEKVKVLSQQSFCKAVSSQQLRGTSRLCRSPIPIFIQISCAIAVRKMPHHTDKTALGDVLLNRGYKGKWTINEPCEHCVIFLLDLLVRADVCDRCVSHRYELGAHLIKLGSTGQMKHHERILETHKDSPSESSKVNKEVAFNKHHPASILMAKIIEFLPNKGDTANPTGVMIDSPARLLELVRALDIEFTKVIANVPKCKRVRSPCFVMGDIHGNIDDLFTLARTIWPRIPCLGAHYLFLGDYVDRGRWSMECALYLLSFMVLCPRHVTMLRGNHEVRSLQRRYSYRKECLFKYGEEMGEEIWEAMNVMFDRLPVCAVVEDKVFGAHGGIPRSIVDLDEVAAKTPHILDDPQELSLSAWEMLWSDPCHMQQFAEMIECMSHVPPDAEFGYLPNSKRGTAYLFNQVAAHNFCKRNHLSYIIRAHEVPQPGFTFHFGNRCVTIFSCSHYCGNNNDSACILIDTHKLRVVRLDTANNPSATDMPSG